MRSFSIFMAALLLSGCGLKTMMKKVEELNLDVNPDPLVLKGDQVGIDITGKFPPKYFAKKAAIEATPVLVWEGGEMPFPSQSYQGEDYAGNATVVSWEGGKAIGYDGTVNYEPAMDDEARLELRITGTMKGKTEVFPPIVLGQGVMATQNLVQDLKDDKFVIAEDNWQYTVAKEQPAVVNYSYNSSFVKSVEKRDDDWKSLGELLALAADADSIRITGIRTESYASPEGEISLNQDLAIDRANSANEAVVKVLEAEGLALDASAIQSIPKGEDWAGFKAKMRASNIPDQDLILRVLEMYTDKSKREEEIKNIAKTYKEIEKTILPELRRSQVAVSYDEDGYTDEELMDYAMSNPARLNVEELLHAATLFEDDNDKLTVYQTATSQFSDDYRGHNNAGVVLMNLDRANQAKDAFNAAKSLAPNNGAVLTNLGAMARRDGDLETADAMYSKASGGAELSFNKGVLAIALGDYDRAISSMGSYNTASLALAKLLNDDANGAMTVLDNSGDDSGMADYLRAICAARLKDNAGVVKYRQQATDKDRGLRAKANVDLEFRNHR